MCVWRCALEVGSIIWNNEQMRMPGVRPPPPACHYLRAFEFANPAKKEQKQTACRSLESVNELCCVFIERDSSKIDRGRKSLEWRFSFFWGRPLQHFRSAPKMQLRTSEASN